MGQEELRRVHQIVSHPVYQSFFKRLEEAERGRSFCTHQMQHLLDVARIAYIHNLEEGMGLSKEVIYAAALLHDIGKVLQYEQNIPHEEAGERIAGQILRDLPDPFTEKEEALVLQAVRGHRRKRKEMEPVEELFYRSDKESRLCFCCPAEKDCDWPKEQKNKEIRI